MKIEPALTPEEWAEWEVTQNGPLCVHRDTLGVLRCGDEYLGDGHALAAVALHGQSFGFTWEMVFALQRAASRLPESDLDEAVLREAAACIASLLPPREL